MKKKMSGLILPGLFVLAWIFTLTGMVPSGGTKGESTAISAILWLLFMGGIAFMYSAFMLTVFAEKMAASHGWKTNGFQYEIAFVIMGLGIACFYATSNGAQAWVTVSLPIITFLTLAGVNHIIDMVRKKNYAPNNTLILIWDFGMSISLLALLPTMLSAR